MHVIYLALGTNLGDRLAYLRMAAAMLPPEVTVKQESQIYETSPWGVEDQPDFLNMVVKGETALSPMELLSYLKNLENELGRQPSFRYGPRQIDLDILFYDDLVLATPHLIIPHPRLQERAFVLVPLAEIAPALRHPIFKKTTRELLSVVSVAGINPYQSRL
ncbi:MAG: 2-amino-4-hydroxy-6-hydroxymethyldihydropteridine diphosphokinase [Anaerolineales bacterium]|nr:2-amino-4-hydroxy-6-hydroxymethyldihydropteridine diphosphokinase [Anaerolineales bacterium]